MMKVCFVSIDIEHDVDSVKNKTFYGIEHADKILQIFAKFNIPAALFITGDIFQQYPEKIKKWVEKYEIASHSYSHRYFNELSNAEKETEIKKFIEIYVRVLGRRPLGFRAPSHVIDNYTFGLLEKYGFIYDSSIVPHYPPFKRYRGKSMEYRGKKWLRPFRRGGIMELPVTGQLMGIPLAGAWIRRLPLMVYRLLFIVHRPVFVTLSMHSWDALDEKFFSKLEKILEILKNSGYVFKSGEQIATELSSGAMERVA